MSVKILVIDRNNRPVSNVKVFVKWKSGTSTEFTNGSGLADLRCSGGIIEQIQVNNYVVLDVNVRVDDDKTYPVVFDR